MKNMSAFIVLVTLTLLVNSLNALADHQNSDESKSFNVVEASTFYSFEANGEDYISGFGGGLTFKDEQSNLGFGLATSFNHAEVLAEDGYIENYVAWEGSVRLGYFSNVFVYAEAGIDLTEVLFHDLRYDFEDYRAEEYHDDLDSFIGVTAGFKIGHLQISAFTRLREIDSLYWEAQSSHFSGVQFSVSF